MEIWSFPSLGEKVQSPSLPPPEVSSFLQGRGGLRGLSLRAAPSTLAREEAETIFESVRARTRVYIYTHTHTVVHTYTHASIDTNVPKEGLQLSDRGGPHSLLELHSGWGARGGARVEEKLITDLADYRESLC